MKNRRMADYIHRVVMLLVLAVAILSAHTASAQTTVYTFQGRLESGGVPANGPYDFQFKLFDAASGGSQQGSTVQQLNVTVSNGDYTVNLDFGAGAFPGADRFLEVSYRVTGSSAYTTLASRQPVTSAPYAIRSLVATSADGLSVTCASCVTSTQIQSVQGAQVTGSISGSQISGAIPVASVPAGSPNYIQNTTSQQANSNFNISGNGTAGGTLSANVVNATSQYNIGGQPVLVSIPAAANLFVGYSAGPSNIQGGNANTFVGAHAGQSNTTGVTNAFFGESAGKNNTTGYSNAFFGEGAGFNNTTALGNAFFGESAGVSNTTGGDNSFFGSGAGLDNTTGQLNSFIGTSAGINNRAGSNNTFVGYEAGFDSTNTTGSNNNLLGYKTRIMSGISNATAIGANAVATANHTVVLGTDQEIVIVPGKLEIDTLGVAGNQQLCLNKQNRLAPCSSSLRYKTDLRPFSAGLSLITRLQPVSFTWKDGGLRDLGLGAEDVDKIEPLLVTRNRDGEVEGVKYDRVAVVLVNAIKEQQQQITAQQTQLAALQSAKAENARLKAQLAGIRLRLERLERRRAARR